MGGFSAMIGNPPWAKPVLRIKSGGLNTPKSQRQTATRKMMIEELRSTEPHTVAKYEADVVENENKEIPRK